MNNGYLFIIFIVIAIVIIGLYFYFIEIKTKNECIINLPLYKNKENKISSLKSNFFNVNKNESVVFVGQIPQDYDYWTINIYDIDKNAIDFISMGNYQTIYPGSTLAIICSSNKYSILETKKYMEKIHYEKYPNRRLYFETFNLDYKQKYYIQFECFLHTIDEIVSNFKLYKYIFDNIYYEKCYNKKIVNSKKKYDNKYEYSICIPKKFLNYKKYNVLIDADIKNKPKECLINLSEKINIVDNEVIIIAFDHFMSKSVIHSHILFIDADTEEIIDIYYTGIISNIINSKFQTTHSFKFSSKIIKNIYVIEKLFFAIDTEDKPLSEIIIPMKIFTKN